MQESTYLKTLLSSREVNTRDCVSVPPLKWKAIISNGVVARVVQLCTKTCNNKVVPPCRMEGNNTITRNQ